LSNEAAIVGLTVYLPDGTVSSFPGEAVRECGVTPQGVPFCTVDVGEGRRRRFIGVVHVVDIAEPSAVQVVPAGTWVRGLA
jgi:hypothetical protein